jgi:methyl-accepting chemotaxis protein
MILITTLVLIFLTNGSLALLGMSDIAREIGRVNALTTEATELTRMSSSVRRHQEEVGRLLGAGSMSWDEASRLVDRGRRHFEILWQAMQTRISADPEEVAYIDDILTHEADLVREGYKQLKDIITAEDRVALDAFLLNEARQYHEPFINSAEGQILLADIDAKRFFAATESHGRFYLILSASAVVLGLLLAMVLGPMIYRSITSPIGNLSAVVRRLTEGDLDARTRLTSRDELGQLGQAFDRMLDDRVEAMQQAERENEALNNSVIELLEAVSDLSNRDLTVAIPVAEDVTGPVSDAMNLMAQETARVLATIRSISNQVAEAALAVESQGGKINSLADSERKIIEDTMTKLNEASKTMNMIAKQAKASNDIAAKASTSTQQAFDSVSKTASGMNEIRETIAETEKRIKRLGERSQEINGIVEIINNIAERTHILALNASMQAAAAGDAGRGFAVVADEVQRLAESSRESTSEIASLVSNIQAETAETMSTMNKAIAQVVEGSELAQASGVQMQATQEATSELVSAVEQIAKRSLVQAHISTNLLEQTDEARRSTEETNAELKLQADQTVNLVQFSKQLLESVNVFKLPV